MILPGHNPIVNLVMRCKFPQQKPPPCSVQLSQYAGRGACDWTAASSVEQNLPYGMGFAGFRMRSGGEARATGTSLHLNAAIPSPLPCLSLAPRAWGGGLQARLGVGGMYQSLLAPSRFSGHAPLSTPAHRITVDVTFHSGGLL